jgi:nucleoside-diphosphate-sugar epimerase
MNEKLFLAGATGAIGTALVPLLINAGYAVPCTFLQKTPTPPTPRNCSFFSSRMRTAGRW